MTVPDRQLLSARDIHKSYPLGKTGNLEVLKGINIDIREGEILAIVGKSGVGKSTLLHILGALDRPTRGQVVLEGKDVFTCNEQQLALFRNRTVGFVFQFHHLLPEFTALENVAMPALIQRMNAKKAFQRAGALLEEVGLGQRQEHRPRELSGGEQQRVAFARALMNDPGLVLADEPSGNLDSVHSESLHSMMWCLVREKKKTFVVVTHNRDLAERADRTIELDDGRLKQV